MKRKFISNLILLLFLNLLIKPIWIFGIDRTVQNTVGDEQYGLYFALFNFSMILNILLDVGITSYNNRNIARYSFLLPKHLSNIIGLKFMLAVFYAVFTMLAAMVAGYEKTQLHLLFFLVFNQFMISFTLYLRSNISALQLFRTDSLVSVLDRSIMIVICGILLFSDLLPVKFSIAWFVYAQTIAYVITAMITFLIVLKKSGRIKFRFNPKFNVVFLRKSYPYALLVLLMTLYNRMDSIFLERLLPGATGEEQAGIYAQAFRLLDAVSMFGVLFAGLLLPIFSRMIKENEEVGPMVRLSYTLLIVPAIIIGVTSLFYNAEIMEFLYHSNTTHSAGILGILMVGFTGIATTYIFGTLLTANGSIKYLNFMAFGGMVLNISLNLILIPRLMAYGAAWSSMVTQLATSAAQMIIAISIFKLKPGYRYVVQLIVFVAGVVLIGLVSQNITHWFYGYVVMIMASVVLAFLLQLYRIKDVLRLISSA